MGSEEEEIKIVQVQVHAPHLTSAECRSLLIEHNWDLASTVQNIPPARSTSADNTQQYTSEDSPLLRRRARATSTSAVEEVDVDTRNGRRDARQWANPGKKLVEAISNILQGIILKPLKAITGIDGDLTEKEAAVRFTENFSLKYGTGHPLFLPTPYNEALLLSQRSNQLLLVYLHSPLHPNTSSFVKDVLCSEVVKQAVEASVKAWAGNIMHSDAFRLKELLGITTFPAIALLSATGSGSTPARTAKLLERIEGDISRELLLQKLRACVDKHNTVLTEREVQRVQAQERQNLREQQNQAFAESERRDREREEEKRRALEEAEREEERKRELLLQEQEALESLRKSIPAEPVAGDVTTIKFNLPNGTKVVRKFSSDDSLAGVGAFMKIHLHDGGEKIENFSFVLNYPKKTFDPVGNDMTLKEAGLSPQAVLFVQDLDS